MAVITFAVIVCLSLSYRKAWGFVKNCEEDDSDLMEKP